jgi:lysine 2,3-aminomutase
MENSINLLKMKIKALPFSKEEERNWNDWKWQVKNVITKIETIEQVFEKTFNQEKKTQLQETIDHFPMAITPYYLSLVDAKNLENDPIFKQAFPDVRELQVREYDMEDPLGEEKDSPVPGITHRYPDRVLLHISNTCAMYCRHCTRKRKVGDRDSIPSKEQISRGLEYIKNTPVIRDVLLSGGDPFLLNDEYLDWILTEVSKIPHIEVVRIGTRTPVVLPQRITPSLLNVLEKHHNLWLNTHFNHQKELTEQAKEAVKKLTRIGIPVGNQSVLLADINDCPVVMKKLVQKLVKNRVRPYYIYQCDLSEGLEHFRTSVGKGIEIMESLRGHTSGFAVPTYVVDAPGGGGKIPVSPNYLISRSGSKTILRNFEGVITTYQEPHQYNNNMCDSDCENCKLDLKTDTNTKRESIGVQRLLCSYDETITLTPESLKMRNQERWEKQKNV